MDGILDQLATAKVFTKIYLRSGYIQIRLSPDSILLTTFNTRYGHLEFLVLPFVLCDALATLMSLINSFFTQHLDKFVIIYLDEILIYSESDSDHQMHAGKYLSFYGKINYIPRN